MEELVASGLFKIGGKLIERLFPDPEQQAKAQLELLKMQNDGQLQEMQAVLQQNQAQAAIDQEEAKSPSLFVNGPRSALEWVCVAGASYQWFFQPIILFIMAASGHTMQLPAFDTTSLVGCTLGLMGLNSWKEVNFGKK